METISSHPRVDRVGTNRPYYNGPATESASILQTRSHIGRGIRAAGLALTRPIPRGIVSVMAGPFLVLLFGAFAASTSVIFIKASTIDPVLLCALRLLLSAALLTPLFARELRRHGVSLNARLLAPSIVPGLVLGVHFMSWTVGARLTAAANSTLIVNLVPVVMPFYVYLLLRETLNRREAVGTIVAMAGVAVLGISDFRFDRTYFLGDMISFVSMLFFALYLVLGRRNNVQRSIWLYLVPLYSTAGLFCLVVALFRVDPFAVPYSAADLVAVAGLAVVATIIGHSALNYAMKLLRPQITSLVNLGQFIFAGVLGYLFFREIPTLSFFVASLLIIAGAAFVIIAAARRERSGAAVSDDG